MRAESERCEGHAEKGPKSGFKRDGCVEDLKPLYMGCPLNLLS